MAFRILDEANPKFNWDFFESTFPGKSVTEQHCREVVLWTLNHPGLEKPEQLQAKERLQKELTKMFQNSNSHPRDPAFWTEIIKKVRSAMVKVMKVL